MLAELGHFALILALCFAFLQGSLPLLGTAFNIRTWLLLARPLAIGQFGFVLLAFVSLAYAFLTNDFTVAYVAAHSNSQLPTLYKFSAIWGGHEGSILLWAFVLSGWTLAVAIFSRSLPTAMLARVIAIMGLISVGFLLFILLTSNPFSRFLPVGPEDGADLNPLLQDPGMAIHPPLLYLGYVGFTVSFAFAIAALLEGRLDSAWARWSRPWANLAWAFLGLGIALGSWWAYSELGWGGWWFWDPVENASLMPWLMGTALIHSLAVTEKRGLFKSWTLLLAIFTFSLSLLGTFLVRSGVLTSVHAFATDPDRGLFILIFLLIVVLGALTLFAIRANKLVSTSQLQPYFSLFSRETALLVNNLLLIVISLMVLLGTLAPLIATLFKLGAVSVGEGYYNLLFTSLVVSLLVMLGLGQSARWQKTAARWLLSRFFLAIVLAFGLAGLLLLVAFDSFQLGAWLGISLAFYLLISLALDLASKTLRSNHGWRGLRLLKPSYYGMVIAHLGVAVCVLGVTFTSLYGSYRDVRIGINETVQLGDYHFTYKGLSSKQGPNYQADVAVIDVYRKGKLVSQLYPEKRFYPVRQMLQTEAAIDPGLFHDLYVSMGEPLGDQGAWSFRLQYKPLVRWIWLGAILMAIGAILAVYDKRYRRSISR